MIFVIYYIMRQAIFILTLLIYSLPLWSQQKSYPPRPWMFTLEESVSLPGLKKDVIEERAAQFRKTADKDGGIFVFDTINWQTMHKVLEYWYPNEEMAIRGRKYKVELKMTVSIVARDGAYTVIMERLEANGYRGNFAVFDDIIRSEDNSGPDGFARGKAKEDIPELCKAFAEEQMKLLLPQIRKAMEKPLVDIHFKATP